MGPWDVAYFLAGKVNTCRAGYTCLKDYLQYTPNMPAESGLCNGYTGGYHSAAEIIAKVGQSCGVSPKALIVLLEKEQSMITDTWPTARQYAAATGFGCPDTAPCDPNYAGFFYQVYDAARQLRNYGLNPARWNYRAGTTTNILYNPDSNCGASPVYIQNRATAALYNYTPYQPNAAALNNLYGVGDYCSAYGNRNFWRIWSDWFGSPTVPAGTPEGSVSINGVAGGIQVSGWALDPDVPTATVSVAFQVNSVWRSVTANQSGADLSSTYPGAGSNHYFSNTLSFEPGTYSVCAYVPNSGGAGSTALLSCQTVNVTPSPDAIGAVTSASATPGSLTISGWALRPDAPSGATNVAVNIGPYWYQATSGIVNSVAPASYPGAGPNQGFSATISMPAGVYQACVWVSKTGAGATQIGCNTVSVPTPAAAKVAISAITASGNSVAVSGWAIWPDSLGTRVNLAINVGSQWWPLTADQPNSAGASAVSGADGNHGFAGSVNLPSGMQNVCIWTTNQGAAPSLVGCRQVAVNVAPEVNQGQVESITGGVGVINVSGWATWVGRDWVPVNVAANIGSSWYSFTANNPNPAAVGQGQHGFGGSISVPPGSYNVCIWMSKAEGGAKFLECRNVTVLGARGPVVQTQQATSGSGGVHLEGWAALPDSPGASVHLAANIGSRWYGFDTSNPNSSAPAAVSGAGPNQGFSALIPADVGPQNVCIWAQGPAGPVFISCQNVVVNPAPALSAKVTSMIGVTGGVQVSGWAVWPGNPTAQVNVAAETGNAWVGMPTGAASTAASTWVAGAGANQGFTGFIAAASGTRTICIWASKPTGGADIVECRQVVVP